MRSHLIYVCVVCALGNCPKHLHVHMQLYAIYHSGHACMLSQNSNLFLQPSICIHFPQYPCTAPIANFLFPTCTLPSSIPFPHSLLTQWSYGVTCWEVFSLGRSPYPGIENHEILEHISGGGRPKKPALCPDEL